MYDSLLDHFSCQPSKPEKAYFKGIAAGFFKADIEASMSQLSSKSTLADVKEVPEQLWKPTRRELGIMVTLAVCSLVYATIGQRSA